LGDRWRMAMDDKPRIDEEIGDALDRVERGEQVTLHRHGAPVAKLVPVDPTWDVQDAKDAIRHMIEFRKGISLGGLRFKDLTHWGHKY